MADVDDYDKLTPEQREAKDKADRAREEAEQAGLAAYFHPSVDAENDDE